MPVPLRYNLRSLLYRRSATLLTLAAVALTVAVLVILLSVNRGFQKSIETTGRADNLLVLRSSATSEGESSLSRSDVNTIVSIPGVAKSADGRPMVAAELYAAVALDKDGGGSTNVTIRGASPASFEVRDGIRISEGRPFSPGSREVVIGSNLVGRIAGCRLGGTVVISHEPWQIVGILNAGGTAFDSEIWGDVELLVRMFDRNFYNSVILRAEPGTAVGSGAVWKEVDGTRTIATPGTGLAGYLTERLGSLKLESEKEYFIRQSGFLGGTLMAASVLLIVLMGIGALSGLTNTFLAAVAGRTREIGGLLAIGYRPLHIFLGFLCESVALSLLGGAIGIACTLPFNGLKTGTMNWGTFTEQAFSFTIDTKVIVTAIIVTVIVGILGGALPALRAARLRPVTALRRG